MLNVLLIGLLTVIAYMTICYLLTLLFNKWKFSEDDFIWFMCTLWFFLIMGVFVLYLIGEGTIGLLGLLF